MGNKRYRVSVVCTFCKKRKVKCDKGNPCSTCVKYGNSNCVYEFKKEHKRIDGIKEVSERQQVDMLKERVKELEAQIEKQENSKVSVKDAFNDSLDNYRGVNPVVQSEEMFDFLEGYCPIRNDWACISFGPLWWVCLMKADPALSLLFTHLKRTAPFLNKRREEVPSAEVPFFDRAVKSLYYLKDEVLNDKDSSKAEFRNGSHPQKEKTSFGCCSLSSSTIAKMNFNATAAAYGLSFYNGTIDHNLDFAGRIKVILPTKKVIWKLIDRFFSKIYPFLPLIDQELFQLKVESIIGKRKLVEERVESIKVSKKSDVAYLGLLLVLLRLSYISLFSMNSSNEDLVKSLDDSPQSQDIKFLLRNPINLDIIGFAHECLNQFNLLKGTNLVVLQLSLFICIYNLLAPEEGDVGDGSNARAYISLLLQMSISLGLNHEPSKFPSVFPDKKENNIRRKIWFYILLQDVLNCISNGLPVVSSSDCYDTKPPFYEEGNENCTDIETEKEILRTYCRIEDVVLRIRSSLILILGVRYKPTIGEVACALTTMERTYMLDEEAIKKLEDVTTALHYHYIEQILSIKIFMQCNGFLLSVYFYLLNFHERRHNHDFGFFYMKKFLYISVLQLLPFYNSLVKNSAYRSTNSTDLFLTPIFEQLVNKSMLFVHSLLLRINFSLYYYENKNNHEDPILLSKLKKVGKLLVNILDLYADFIKVLSSRYYHAWKILKAVKYHFKIVKEKNFFEDNKNSPLYGPTTLSIKNLEDLIQLFEETFSRIEALKGNTVHEETPTLPSIAFNDTEITTSDEPGDVQQNLDDVDNIWFQMISIRNDSNEKQHGNSQFSVFRSGNEEITRFGSNEIPIAESKNKNFPDLQFEPSVLDELFRNFN